MQSSCFVYTDVMRIAEREERKDCHRMQREHRMRATTITTIACNHNRNMHTIVGIDISNAEVTKIILFELKCENDAAEREKIETHGQQGPIIQFILLDEST